MLSATLGRRFGNYVVDGILVSGTAVALWGLLAVFGVETVGDGGYGVQIVAYLIAYVFPEAVFGRSLGKLLTRTKVVDLEGRRPSVGQVLLRTAIRWVPFEPLSFLFGDNIGWHDKWSKTRVVMNVNA